MLFFLLSPLLLFCFFFFFFNDTATTEIYTLSLHDALPISGQDAVSEIEDVARPVGRAVEDVFHALTDVRRLGEEHRSEEHTSELQSLAYLVCRLLLEKKKNKQNTQDGNVSLASVKPTLRVY